MCQQLRGSRGALDALDSWNSAAFLAARMVTALLCYSVGGTTVVLYEMACTWVAPCNR
jgi:hypothetical protein